MSAGSGSRGRFRSGVTVAVLAALLCLAGCGKKGLPQAPADQPQTNQYQYPRVYPGELPADAPPAPPPSPEAR